ncbi:MAG: hypothetical protein PW791_08185 [Neorhizobium sp.]|nr:hypothetical protein [Neorhizobium sp.]
MTTPRIRVLQSISDPGHAGRPNEDRFGFNEATAFVVDGATGLGDRQYMDGADSDAAWIASHYALGFQQGVTESSPIGDVTRGLSVAARDTFLRHHPDAPRYAWPLAAFAMLQTFEHGIYVHGLGDSCVFLLQADGSATMHMAVPDAFTREQSEAQRHIERTGGISSGGGTLGNAETLAALRASRMQQNRPGARVWTLGLVPDAADRIVSERLRIDDTAHALVCSDGLADLVVLYAAYDPAGLVNAARNKGLTALVDELRTLEREVDPEGLRFPRYKRSDDTTALLVELNP